MSAKKRNRREQIAQIVTERGSVTVGSLAELLDVTTQTIRRDIDKLCEGDTLRRRHGRVELEAEQLNTPFDERAGTNLAGKRDIGEAAVELIPSLRLIFLRCVSTVRTDILSVFATSLLDWPCASSSRIVCSRLVSASRPSLILGRSDPLAPVQRYSPPAMTISIAARISSVGTSLRI